MDLFRKLGRIPEEGPSFRIETSCSINDCWKTKNSVVDLIILGICPTKPLITKLRGYKCLGAARPSPWYPNLNGSHFGLPPVRTTVAGPGGSFLWTALYTYDVIAYCPFPGLQFTLADIASNFTCNLEDSQFPLPQHQHKFRSSAIWTTTELCLCWGRGNCDMTAQQEWRQSEDQGQVRSPAGLRCFLFFFRLIQRSVHICRIEKRKGFDKMEWSRQERIFDLKSEHVHLLDWFSTSERSIDHVQRHQK